MNILTFFELIITNNWILFFLSLFGLAVGAYGIKNLFHYKRISYCKHRIELPRGIMCSEGNVNGCSKRKEKLYITQVAIWNSGRKYINDVDIAQKLPLKIIGSKSCKLLDCFLVYQNNQINSIECKLNAEKNEIIIDFDFLDKNDGMVLNVVSEGEVDELSVDVFIKGGKVPHKFISLYDWLINGRTPYRYVSNKLFGWGIVFFGLVMCPIAFLQSANFYPIKNNFFELEGMAAFIIDIFLLICLFAYSFGSAIPFLIGIFFERMPRNLRAYFSNNGN